MAVIEVFRFTWAKAVTFCVGSISFLPVPHVIIKLLFSQFSCVTPSWPVKREPSCEKLGPRNPK